MLTVLWLLSQAVGFALPTMSDWAGQEMPPVLACEQHGNHDYDADFLSCLVYDMGLPYPTTAGLSDPLGIAPTNPVYDSCLVSTIPVVGAPRAPSDVKGGFVAAKETQVVVREGEYINRVWDSRWTPGSSYSGPFGGSYSPHGALPINAATAIETRGLNIPGVLNNAERGAVYSPTRDIPAILKTSYRGTEPELFIAPEYRQYLNQLDPSISTIPAGR